MNQADLRKLSEERLKDAEALLASARWEFAYYAAGYSVECALKSCILARMILTGLVFQEKWDAKECRDHNLRKLVALAGLTDELDNLLKASAAAGGEFVNNWSAVEKWTVSSRYEPKTKTEAQELVSAIAQVPYGVLEWTKKHW